MGFKCPACLKDFGTDKEKWLEHISKEHEGTGKDILNIVIKSTNAGDKNE